MNPSHFSELKAAKTILIDRDDYDVFGDGTVVIKSTPGHTPGHQVLVVKLPKSGTIVLAGDLYHYPEERRAQKFPTFEFNVEKSRASRAQVEDFVKQLEEIKPDAKADAVVYRRGKKETIKDVVLPEAPKAPLPAIRRRSGCAPAALPERESASRRPHPPRHSSPVRWECRSSGHIPDSRRSGH